MQALQQLTLGCAGAVWYGSEDVVDLWLCALVEELAAAERPLTAHV